MATLKWLYKNCSKIGTGFLPWSFLKRQCSFSTARYARYTSLFFLPPITWNIRSSLQKTSKYQYKPVVTLLRNVVLLCTSELVCQSLPFASHTTQLHDLNLQMVFCTSEWRYVLVYNVCKWHILNKFCLCFLDFHVPCLIWERGFGFPLVLTHWVSSVKISVCNTDI